MNRVTTLSPKMKFNEFSRNVNFQVFYEVSLNVSYWDSGTSLLCMSLRKWYDTNIPILLNNFNKNTIQGVYQKLQNSRSFPCPISRRGGNPA